MNPKHALLTLWFAAVVVAQGHSSKPLVGQVRGPDGPLAAATVTLVGIGSWFDPSLDAPDVVEAATDARGFFRANVLPGLPYAAFAAGPPDARGARSRSTVDGWFGAGATITLVCAAADGPFAVTVKGLDAWGGQGALLRTAQPACEGGMLLPFAVANPGDKGGVAAWPAIPGGAVRIATATGQLQWLRTAPLGGADALALPPPRELRCSVVDDQGAPVPGASIRWRADVFTDDGIDGVQTMRRRLEVPVGTTGTDGTVTLRLPVDDPLDKLAGANAMFVASAPRRQERVSGYSGTHWFRDDQRIAPDGDATLRFTLAPVPPVRGTVTFDGAAAGRFGSARLDVVAKLQVGKGSYVHDPRSYATAVAADGTFAFDGVPTDVRQSQLLLFPRDGGAPVAASPVVGRDPGARFELTALATLQLSMFDARRGPAAGHVVYLRAEPGPRSPVEPARLRACVDAAGRAELSLWPGDWFVFAADGEACAWSHLTLVAGQRQACELRLDAFPVVRGLLRGDDGEPVAGAAVVLRGIATANPGPRDEGDPLARSFLRAHAQRMLRAVRSDRTGAFAIPYPPLDDLVLNVQFIGGARSSPRFDLRRGDALNLRWQ